MRGLVITVALVALLVGACKSEAHEYEQRAASVSENWATAIVMMDLYIASQTKTNEEIANLSLSNACGSVALFELTDEPAEYEGTKSELMATGVGRVLTCESIKSGRLESWRDAADSWTAIMIRNGIPLTVDD